MSDVVVRPYAETDRDARAGDLRRQPGRIFRGWRPRLADRDAGRARWPRLCRGDDGRAAAFGGYEVWEHYNKALLYWGMAAPAYHGCGLGGFCCWRGCTMSRSMPGRRRATSRSIPRPRSRPSSCVAASSRPPSGPKLSLRHDHARASLRSGEGVGGRTGDPLRRRAGGGRSHPVFDATVRPHVSALTETSSSRPSRAIRSRPDPVDEPQDDPKRPRGMLDPFPTSSAIVAEPKRKTSQSFVIHHRYRS